MCNPCFDGNTDAGWGRRSTVDQDHELGSRLRIKEGVEQCWGNSQVCLPRSSWEGGKLGRLGLQAW